MTTQHRILIVEDQKIVAADLQNTLVRLGYEVAGTASVAEEAIRKAEDLRPDLVLMDIRLRGEMDGIEAAGAIRSRFDIPVVYLTAYVDEETIKRAKATAPFGYLVKPFNERELRAAIEIAMDKHEADRRIIAQQVELAQEQSLRRAAEEAIRARDEFLAIASHELRTPLTPLLIHIGLMKHALTSQVIDKGELSGHVEAFERQVDRLIRQVESLLDVSRIARGMLVLNPENFDFSSLVQELALRFRGEALQAGSTITARADSAFNGSWDRLRMEQVISNLLSNAIKYGQGQPIEVEVQGDDDVVKLIVTDKGMGMSEEALSRIFDRFERAVSARNFGGLGLGLYISSQIVESHGGSIVAQSQLGQGTTFWVELPRETVVEPIEERSVNSIEGV